MRAIEVNMLVIMTMCTCFVLSEKLGGKIFFRCLGGCESTSGAAWVLMGGKNGGGESACEPGWPPGCVEGCCLGDDGRDSLCPLAVGVASIIGLPLSVSFLSNAEDDR
jgi:hypothetical protein